MALIMVLSGEKSLKNENNETCPLKNPNIWEIRLTFFVNKKNN